MRHFYQFGRFRLDKRERVLMREGAPVKLTPKAFATLLTLVERRGHVVEKDELMRAVWPDTMVVENNLNRNIFMLRKALGERPSGQTYIETIPRRGFRFTDRVKEVRDEGTNRLGRAVRSLAVLPFRTLSGDDAYLGLGMTDALITRLSRIRGISVRPTSAVRKYAGRRQDPLAIGHELRVGSVLDGSIQQVGERVRATVQLVSVPEQVPLWAEKFDAKSTDIFEVEDSISEQVARALALKLTEKEKKGLTRRGTENPAAYHAYLKGRYYASAWTTEGFRKGIDYLNQAIDLDPAYALAYTGLSDAYYYASTVYLPPLEALPKAKAAALRALELDDALAEAHAALGVILEYYDWDWAGAERAFTRAIELDPNRALARFWYGLYLADMGRLDESLTELRRAQRLDPLSLEITTFVALPLFCARQYDQAVDQLRRATEMNPNYHLAHWFLGWAHEQLGQPSEAIAEYQTALLSNHDPIILAALGHACGVAGMKAEAEKVLEELTELSHQRYVSAYDMAMVCLGLGKKGQALAWLENAHEERSVWMVRLNVDQRLDELRSDPRFQDLLTRVGLPCRPGVVPLTAGRTQA